MSTACVRSLTSSWFCMLLCVVVLLVVPTRDAVQAEEVATNAVADVVFRNARFYTLVGASPGAVQQEPRVEAVAARGGRIVALGTWEEVQRHVGKRTVVHDLRGATAVPGLVDAHAHMRNQGRLLEIVDLVGTQSYDEVIERVAEVAADMPAGSWIRGRGWDQNDWDDTTFPDHEKLSREIPEHPVYLRRVDGHAALANQRAMQLAGVDAQSQAPAGGRILRRPDGTPTGVFVDKAEELVTHVMPKADLETRVRWFDAAMQLMLSLGLTGMHDAGVTGPQIEAYRWMLERGQLSVRVYGMLDARPDTEDLSVVHNAMQHGPEDYDPTGRLALRSVKFALDGALGSRGAALLQPYSDEPDVRGLMQHSRAQLEDRFLKLHRAGFQIAVHAIGDEANRMSLDVLEAIQKQEPRDDPRHRIEHAQVLTLADIPRFATLGVIPSMQPTHCTSDMPWAPDRLGPDRLAGAYAWRALRDTGVILPAGSDAPVESINPLWGIYAAVTRQTVDGHPPQGWSPDQRLTRSEAVRAFTIWAAHASFAEDDLGTLEVGKWLDLSVFERDILTCEATQLLTTRTVMTVVGGDVAYDAR